MRGVMHYIADDLGSAFRLDYFETWLANEVDLLACEITSSYERHQTFERWLRAMGIE